MKKDNVFFMTQAIKEAHKGINANHGGPFGCVIVKDNKIIARAHNEVIKNQDPTCHGEIQAIRKACKKLKTFDLSDCVLYTTSEPCVMCRGAILWSKISKVYSGCSIADAQSIGFADVKFETQKLNQEFICKDQALKLFDDYKKLSNKTPY